MDGKDCSHSSIVRAHNTVLAARHGRDRVDRGADSNVGPKRRDFTRSHGRECGERREHGCNYEQTEETQQRDGDPSTRHAPRTVPSSRLESLDPFLAEVAFLLTPANLPSSISRARVYLARRCTAKLVQYPSQQLRNLKNPDMKRPRNTGACPIRLSIKLKICRQTTIETTNVKTTTELQCNTH